MIKLIRNIYNSFKKISNHHVRNDNSIYHNTMLSENIVKNLVKKYGSPLYIYDKRLIESRLKAVTSVSYRPLKIFAATMANNNVELLKLYKKFGLGVFVNSIKHMGLCKKAGFSGQDIMWTSTGMTARQMKSAIKEGTMLNLDSLSQVKLYGSLNPGSKVGIRVNIGDMPDNETYAGVFVGRNSRIGIFAEEFPTVQMLAKKYNLTIVGLHIYLGTQIESIAHFKMGINMLFESVESFRDIEYLDLGGGFAIPEGKERVFDFKKYGVEISKLMENISKKYGKKIMLILEPGRVLAGDAGYFVTKVTDVKLRDDYKYIFVEGSSAIFTRPLLYPQLPNHPHYVIGKTKMPKIKNVDICGSTTYSRDFLARASNEIPKNISIGDIVVFKNAGSYSYSSKTDFLGIETPPQVLTDGIKTKIISKGEQY